MSSSSTAAASDLKRNLKTIIDNTVASPTIINEKSRFVVCTYWWGRGNKNNNTARPCLSFYEEIIGTVKSYAIKSLLQTMQRNQPIDALYNTLETTLLKDEAILSRLQKIVSKYAGAVATEAAGIANIPKYISVESTPEGKRELLDCKLKSSSSKYKAKIGDRLPVSFQLEKTLDLQNTVFFDTLRISMLYIHSAKKLLLQYAYITNKAHVLKKKHDENTTATKDIVALKAEIQQLVDEKNRLNTELTKVMGVKHSYDDFVYNAPEYKVPAKQMYSAFKRSYVPDYPVEMPAGVGPEDMVAFWEESEFDNNVRNKSITQMLTERLGYLGPLTYDQMIANWEKACASAGCNYMAVEYPEFAKPGGYQMAINAKPMFIKKALELCGGRNVLYIDGDMTINKYPHIFDMEDVDYMARGWWIDPRSSYRMNETITYDPYLFETSGGTMFFSQSLESKRLIDKWIEESDKPSNAGKADDRIISLIFNTNRLLLNMKIMQLPIEYLWLTLDYDDRMAENVEWDAESVKKIRESIFIEHPECLTSEDTATGAGAASNRMPKFYSAIDENALEPVSEEMHEVVLFPTPELTDAFRDYHEYISNTTYIDDGNPILYEKKLVDKTNPANNEYPVYMTPYAERFGNKRTLDFGDGELYSPNEIVDANLKGNVNMDQFEIGGVQNNSVELRVKRINGATVPSEKDIIRAIIKLLLEGKSVYYNPIHMPNYESAYYQQLLHPRYANLDLVFSPNIVGYTFHSMYKPSILKYLPMFFKAGNPVLVQFLSMFLSFDDMSEYLRRGTYEFLSRMRIGYLFKPKVAKTAAKNTIAGGNADEIMRDYNDTLEYFYKVDTNATETKGGRAKTARRRKNAKKTRKVRFSQK